MTEEGIESPTMALGPEQVRLWRLRSQRLDEKAGVADLAQVVRSICGVNAQSRPAMMLALRARIRGLGPEDVRDALERKHSLVRSWAMRGTIHLLDPDDLGWMVSLLGPALIKKGTRRRRELGLTDAIAAKAMGEISAILGDSGSLTRDELTERLNDRGVQIERKGQAPYHLMAMAGLSGLICMGPDRPDGEPTYRLYERRPGGGSHFSGDAELVELVRRYLAGHGPATRRDFSAWSGLPAATAGRGWGLALAKGLVAGVKVDDRELWALRTPEMTLERSARTGCVVNLLPAFDSYVLGYADRGDLVPAEHREEVYHGGQTVPVLLVDGLAAGVWRYRRRGKAVEVVASPFRPLDRETRALVEEEAEDIGRFFGQRTALVYRS